MVREVEYLILSMMRTPCWKDFWSYGSTLISKLFYTKKIEISPWKCEKEVLKVFSFKSFFALGWHI
jgi:hypothetical protein